MENAKFDGMGDFVEIVTRHRAEQANRRASKGLLGAATGHFPCSKKKIPVTSVQQMFLADQNGRVPRSVQGMAAASSGDMESWSYRELVERLSMLVENDDPESEDGFSPDALEVVDIITRRFGPASKTEGGQHAI